MTKTYIVMYKNNDTILFATDNKKEAEEYSRDYLGSEVIECG